MGWIVCVMVLACCRPPLGCGGHVGCSQARTEHHHPKGCSRGEQTAERRNYSHFQTLWTLFTFQPYFSGCSHPKGKSCLFSLTFNSLLILGNTWPGAIHLGSSCCCEMGDGLTWGVQGCISISMFWESFIILVSCVDAAGLHVVSSGSE